MSDTLSWFPMYHGDYLRDTGDLSPTEHGVYLLLLMAFVARGPLQDDLNRLCRIAAGAEPEDVRQILQRYWVRTESGWVNGKMQRVITTQTEKHQKRVNAGRMGGQKKASNAKAMLKQCSTNQNQNQISTNVDKKEKKEKDGRRFTPPSVPEVKKYCLERGNQIDAEEFVDHYAANGWMRGKSKIKDWKACIRTWEKSARQKPKSGNNGTGSFQSCRTPDQLMAAIQAAGLGLPPAGMGMEEAKIWAQRKIARNH